MCKAYESSRHIHAWGVYRRFSLSWRKQDVEFQSSRIFPYFSCKLTDLTNDHMDHNVLALNTQARL